METKFVICTDSLCEGMTVLVLDETNHPAYFATEAEAQREIAEEMMTRLQEFLDGEREFEDATQLSEFIEEVQVLPDGRAITLAGNAIFNLS